MSPRISRPEWWEYHPQARLAYVAGAILVLTLAVGGLLVVLS